MLNELEYTHWLKSASIITPMLYMQINNVYPFILPYLITWLKISSSSSINIQTYRPIINTITVPVSTWKNEFQDSISKHGVRRILSKRKDITESQEDDNVKIRCRKIIQESRLKIDTAQVQETQTRQRNPVLARVNTLLAVLTNFRHDPWNLTKEQLGEFTNISNSTKALLKPPNLTSKSNFTSQQR
jgi:hypothetical protein